MEDSQKTEMNINMLSSELTKHDIHNSGLGVSKILKMAIKRYQFDVVGWTEYCIDNKDLKQKALPVYRQKFLEDLRIQNKILTSLSTPSIKKVYESPNHYIQWLNEEYSRDKAFYETILKNPIKSKTDSEDLSLNEEIDKSAMKYLKTIDKRKINEEALIRGIQDENWCRIKKSKYPKVQLGVILGASGEAIVNNFCIYFINQLGAILGGSKTAFLSLTGPATWYEIDQYKAELEYFKKEVVDSIVKNLK
jgi:hypothetical protein